MMQWPVELKKGGSSGVRFQCLEDPVEDEAVSEDNLLKEIKVK